MKPSSYYPPGFSQGQSGPADHSLADLPPFLRALLVSDGTVTKLLEAYLWEPIRVHLRSQVVLDGDPFGQGVSVRFLRRDIALETRGTARLYAAARSFVQLDGLEPDIESGLITGQKGIGELLREERIETYRYIVGTSRRMANDVDIELGIPSGAAVVARTYRIHRRHGPIIEVNEHFPVDAFR
jgi:chorismate-pyruvate lyase